MTASRDRPGWRTGAGSWAPALVFAAPIAALVVYLFYRWFAVEDRYLVFLYYHAMGPGFDTAPFGWVTAGRYWMAGLVAGGAVLVAYTSLNLLLGRLVNRYRAPQWWRVWALGAMPVLIAIPAIVMTANDPVLPAANAAQVTAAALAGLALAVMSGDVAAERPLTLLLLIVDGLGLACLLIALAKVESLPAWLARGRSGFAAGLLALAGAGLLLLAATTALYRWRGIGAPRATSVFVAGLDVAYLALPLCHYLASGTSAGGSGHFHYITDAANFYATNAVLQFGVWVTAGLVALGVTRLRLHHA